MIWDRKRPQESSSGVTKVYLLKTHRLELVQLLATPVGTQVGSAPAVTLKQSKGRTAAAHVRHQLQQQIPGRNIFRRL